MLALTIWAALSAGAWGLGEAYISQVRAQRTQAALARAMVGAEALEQTLLRTTEAVEGILELSQTRESLLENGDMGGATAIADHMRSLARQEKFGILQVATIAASGWMSWSSTDASEPVWLGDREHFLIHKNGRRELFISAPLIGRASKRWSEQFTRPLLHRDGTFAGVTVVSFDPLKMSATMSNLHFGENGFSFVLRVPEGNLMARSEDAERQLGRPAMPDLPVVRAAAKAPSGSMEIMGQINNRPLLIAYRTVGALPLVVAVALDKHVELGVVDSVAGSVHATAVAVSLLIAALCAVQVQRVARRLARDEITKTRGKVEAAELAARHVTRLLSGLPAAVYGATLNADGSIVSFEMTENAVPMTGWTADELSTWQGWMQRVDDLDAGAWSQHFRNVLEQGEDTLEYRFNCPDGRTLWLRDQVRVFERRGNREVAVVGYISDQTRTRVLQGQAVAAAKLATLGEMAAGLAHELNQPLAIMSLAAENATLALNRKGADGIGFAMERMRRITEQAGRARSIVDHLRIFGRSDEGKLGPVDLAAVVQGSLTLVGSTLRSAGVTLDISLPEDLPHVLGTQVLMEHVLVNLMINARDAMEHNPADRPHLLHVSAVREPDAAKVVLTVRDAGPGIPPDVLDRIFEPFFTTKEVGKGTGLGLSICHGIIRSFGGSIDVRNAPDGGAVFSVHLRCAETSDRQGDAVSIHLDEVGA